MHVCVAWEEEKMALKDFLGGGVAPTWELSDFSGCKYGELGKMMDEKEKYRAKNVAVGMCLLCPPSGKKGSS